MTTFNKDMFKRDPKDAPYCKHCADTIGKALAEAEGMDFEKGKEAWHQRGKTALTAVMAIVRDEKATHDE